MAVEEGLPFPSSERALYDLRPERAITEVQPCPVSPNYLRDGMQRLAWPMGL